MPLVRQRTQPERTAVTNSRNVAIIVGSLRKDSLNRKLANALIAIAPPELSMRIDSSGGAIAISAFASLRLSESLRRLPTMIATLREFVTAVLSGCVRWRTRGMRAHYNFGQVGSSRFCASAAT